MNPALPKIRLVKYDIKELGNYTVIKAIFISQAMKGRAG